MAHIAFYNETQDNNRGQMPLFIIATDCLLAKYKKVMLFETFFVTLQTEMKTNRRHIANIPLFLNIKRRDEFVCL